MNQKPFTVLGVAVAIVFGLSLRAEDTADSDFLIDAMRTDIAEVQMAKLAQERAQDDAVRSYAERLQTDHSRSLQEASALALTLSVQVPTEASDEAQAHYQALESLSGSEFDAAYIGHMIAGHQAAIQKFGAQRSSNREIAALVAKTLPVLREHLAKAESLKKHAVHEARYDRFDDESPAPVG